MKEHNYPDAEYWIEYMTDAEMLFLILFCEANSHPLSRNKKLMPCGIISKTKSIDIEEDKTDDAEFTIGFEKPDISVFMEIRYSGKILNFEESSYDDPGYGGDPEFETVDIDYIGLMKDGDAEDFSSPKLVKEKFDKGFSYENVTALALRVFIDNANGDLSKRLQDFMKRHFLKELPLQVKEKIEQVREQNKELIRANTLGKRYGV